MADAPIWLQALGPFATLAAAGAATFVTWRIGKTQTRISEGQREIAAAQRDIAASQRDLAKMRLRMDLHDKRLEISQATFAMMKGTLAGMIAQGPEFSQLRGIVQQHRFFFDALVSAAVDVIDTDCIALAVHHQMRDPNAPGTAELQEAERAVAKHLDRWPAPFGEVMAFRDVE